MYESFYRISKNPFSLTPDPGFLLMTRAHSNAKSGLMYSIMTGKGFTVLTGDAGTGKTTLLRSVINSIPSETLCFSLVSNPVLTPEEFFEAALTDFGLPMGISKPERVRNLQTFLLEVHAAGKKAVLFVDEAHRLSIETLEEIRLLTNFETNTKKLLQIVLVGQDELGGLLDLRELRQLKQRIEVRLEVGPLFPDEVGMYIKHRWSCVGAFEAPFSADAVRLISRITGGIPRLINSVCDNALLLGFAESSPVITEQHILEVNKDLHLAPVGSVPGGKKRAERSMDRVGENGHERTSGQLTLQIPPPVSGYNHHPLSLFGDGQPKRTSWWRMSRAAKA